MAEIIRSWFRSRLGVIIDLTPEVFGHYCRDGTFLAKLLHSYDIISDSQLNTIIPTSDPALARVNLRHLRVWLKFIGITCDDKTIQDISNGKGTASLRLFYKVFLCLENKDRLHFITLEKEREKYIPTSTKFDVKVVREDISFEELPKHPLSNLLEDNANNLEWYKKKFQRITDDFRRERESFRESQKSKESLHLSSTTSDSTSNKEIAKNSELKELDIFAKKHKVISRRQISTKSEQLKKDTDDSYLQEDAVVAKEFTNILKKNKQRAIEIHNFKSQMQKMLLSRVWEIIENDKEKEFDKIVTQKVLRQSRYEKKMIRKLCDIRNEKRRLAANRQLVDELTQKTWENHLKMIQESERQNELWENEEVDDECRRRNELHLRMTEEKLKICREEQNQITNSIINDIFDIVTVAAEFKHHNNGIIPEYMWHEWRCLFVHNVPIIKPLTTKIFHEESEECSEEIVMKVPSRESILCDKDFEDYHNLKPQWDEFIPKLDKKNEEFLYLGNIVLGYIVHRIFNSARSHSLISLRQHLPDVKVRAVVLGIPDPSFYPQIQELLKHRKIKLVQPADAINHCLLRYKEEMKNYEHIELDIEVDKSRKNSQLSVITNKSNNSSQQIADNNKKHSKKTKTSSMGSGIHAKNVINKQIQTPKNIPYEDINPVLSNTAYVGKWIYELFAVGKPISDKLITQSIFEYLKNFKDIQGWVLLDYPHTYEQMVTFERMLSGNDFLDVLESIQSNELSCKDDAPKISTHSSNSTFHFQHSESIKSFEDSKLVPNPLNKINSQSETSHLTAFIRVLLKPKKVDIHPEEIFEILPQDSTVLDEFYKDQRLASVVYYSLCDISTIKRVARIIIGETSLPRKSSTELFGQVSENLEHIEERSQLNSEENIKPAFEEVMVENRKPKPGESEWSWVDFPIPHKISKALTLMWQNLENIYIDGLKSIFLQRRSIFLTIIPYKEFVHDKMAEFLKQKPENSLEDLLRDFQTVFNEVPDDARDDDEVKNELHLKIYQFETELWNICNEQRRQAEEQRKSFILTHWTAVQVIDLINIYLTIIQLELDRFIDTLKFIQTYYLSILQRPLQDEKFLKIQLSKLNFDGTNSLKVEKNVSSQVTLEEENKKKDFKLENFPVFDVKENDIKDEISKMLLSLETPDNFRQLCCYKIIGSSTEFVDSIINNMLQFVMNSFENKEKSSLSRRTSDRKGKSKSSKKTSISSHSKEETDMINGRLKDLFVEWEYAVMYEINRIQMRVKILEASVKSDIGYLLRHIHRAFFFIDEMVNEKYGEEINNVNIFMEIFRIAVEEERPVKGAMPLNTEDFAIADYISAGSKTESISSHSFEEQRIDNLKFAPKQLGQLKDIFQNVAPSGWISERSFIYIIQDLIVCGKSNHDTPLPSSWYKLTSQNVIEMVDKLFNGERYINWREFIISLLDIAVPNQDELLDAREVLQKKDPKFTEVIFNLDFLLTPLWFFKSPKFPSNKLSLHYDVDQDTGRLLEEELGTRKNTQLTSTFMKSESYLHISELRTQFEKNTNLDNKILQQKGMIELCAIKQILSELFLVSYCTLNYMALLLAFCKSDNPSYGLGKAISLTLGKKICLNYDQGEKYLNKLLEERRLENELQSFLRPEIFGFCRGIIDMVIDEMMDNYELTLVEITSTSNINNDMKSKKQISMKKFDSLGEVIDPANQLIEQSQLSDSDSNKTNDKVPNNLSDINKSSLITTINDEKSIRTREIIYWIPTRIFESVLLGSTKLNMNKNDELYPTTTLNEYFQSIYREIRCKEIEEKLGIVLAHRLLHHPKVIKILQLTNEFTYKNTLETVASLLKKHHS